ncbi:MAG: hypothetical protein LBK52_03000, partial [Deltaproteobacteria bacterium]|nr:hypothetical protein [Deltaproteobacteria bacterium]
MDFLENNLWSHFIFQKEAGRYTSVNSDALKFFDCLKPLFPVKEQETGDLRQLLSDSIRPLTQVLGWQESRRLLEADCRCGYDFQAAVLVPRGAAAAGPGQRLLVLAGPSGWDRQPFSLSPRTSPRALWLQKLAETQIPWGLAVSPGRWILVRGADPLRGRSVTADLARLAGRPPAGSPAGDQPDAAGLGPEKDGSFCPPLLGLWAELLRAPGGPARQPELTLRDSLPEKQLSYGRQAEKELLAVILGPGEEAGLLETVGRALWQHPQRPSGDLRRLRETALDLLFRLLFSVLAEELYQEEDEELFGPPPLRISRLRRTLGPAENSFQGWSCLQKLLYPVS